MIGCGIKFFQYLDRALRIESVSDEFFSTPEQRDIQRRGNLPQIFIDRPAQVGKPRVVDRLRRKIARRRLRGFRAAARRAVS